MCTERVKDVILCILLEDRPRCILRRKKKIAFGKQCFLSQSTFSNKTFQKRFDIIRKESFQSSILENCKL